MTKQDGIKKFKATRSEIEAMVKRLREIKSELDDAGVGMGAVTMVDAVDALESVNGFIYEAEQELKS